LQLSFFAIIALLLNGISYAWLPKRIGASCFAQGQQKQFSSKAPTRRALLVPIGNYSGARIASAGKGQPQGAKQRDSGSDDPGQPFNNLYGPKKDADDLKKLLVARYGFKEGHVDILPESEATHDGILQAIQRYLIDATEPGDECLFYYSGHGSFVVNSKSDQENKQDETIVPIDYVRPVTRKEDIKDIRDKELAQYFNRALDKGVVLTAVFDSCHSGSIARSDVIARAGAGIKFDIAESPAAQKKPAERGALILSAALANQPALERDYDGVYRGDFTNALLEVLSNSDAEQFTAEQVFYQIVARMKGRGIQAEPNMDPPNGDRRKRNLFGSPTGNQADQPLFVVLKKTDAPKGEVLLDKGKAYGLTEGSELVSKTGTPPIRLRITSVPDMTSSTAIPINPLDLRRIKEGDNFEQDKWVASKESIHIWMPSSNLSLSDLRKLAKDASTLKSAQAFRVISDPTAEPFTHRLFHDGTIWKIDLPTGRTIEIGRDLTAQAVKEKSGMSKDAKLFISLPLFKELRDRVGLGPGTKKNAVNTAANEGAATYKLIGRSEDGQKIEYAWVLNIAIQAETESENAGGKTGKIIASKPSPFPPITDWISAGETVKSFHAAAAQIEDFALRLNKISGWITLKSPLEPDELGNRFPYKLVLTKDDGTPLGENERLVEEGIYRLTLVAEKRDLEQHDLDPRWVYVFSIDGKGDSSLLYPGDQGIGNRFPKEDPAASITLSRFRIKGAQRGGVLGPETYVLLTTREKLAAPGALEFQGVRTRSDGGEKGRAEKSPLDVLLEDIGAVSRSGERVSTGANWTVQQVFLESVPRK
jgi:hypothetical protein